MRQVKKYWKPIPIILPIKIPKICKDFQKALEIKTRDTIATGKPEVTTTTKNNDRGITDRNTTRETELQWGRYNHYFKVSTRDYSNSKERYSKTLEEETPKTI